MNEHWQYKKARSKGMSNETINEFYDHALANGAVGGKLIGAGGGGFFFFFYTTDKQRLLRGMRTKGLSEVRFNFDFQGTTILNHD